MNDCKYGYSVANGEIGLTLLRSPTYPDPDCDKGIHEFVYSLYPHIGDVRNSDVYMQAYLLNNPFISLKANGNGALPVEFSLISTDKQNVIVDTIKKAEDSEDVIVRLFECSNKTTNVTVKLSIPVKKVVVCDLMEKESDFVLQSTQTFKLTVKPFEIITLKLCI